MSPPVPLPGPVPAGRGRTHAAGSHGDPVRAGAMALALFFGILRPTAGWAEQPLPAQLQGAALEERLGARLPMEAAFRDASGKAVRLGDFFEPGIPVIVNMVYFECPMLCTLVMNGLVSGLRELGRPPGKKYRILTVSMDPDEGPELARKKKAAYLAELGMGADPAAWMYWTGTEASIRALAEAIGFGYRPLENGDFAHGAGLVFASPQGRVARYLYGVQFGGFDLKRALLDAQDEKYLSLADRIVMYCYRYSPDERGYVLFARNAMRGGGAVVLAACLILFGGLWRRDLKRRKTAQTGTGGRA